MVTHMNRAVRAGRKELSQDRILDVAARDVRRSGFASIGVANVMKQAGLTHGGFYAHFASRDDLLRAATNRAGRDSRDILKDHIDRLVTAGVPPFRALVETYLHESGLEDIENGCPVAALASELPRQSQAVQEEGRDLIVRLHRLIQEALGDAGSTDEAWPIASALVGALQLARAVGDREQGRAILAATKRSLLQRHAPQASS
mgnify:CR=1 FL=1